MFLVLLHKKSVIHTCLSCFPHFFLCVFKILYYDQSTKPVPSQLAFFWIQNTGNEQYTALQL